MLPSPFYFLLLFSETLRSVVFLTLLMPPSRIRRREKKCQFGSSGNLCLLQCSGVGVLPPSSSSSLPHPPPFASCCIFTSIRFLFFPSPSLCFDFGFVYVSSCFPPPLPPSPLSSCFLLLSGSLGSESRVGARLRHFLMCMKEEPRIPVRAAHFSSFPQILHSSSLLPPLPVQTSNSTTLSSSSSSS